MAPTSDGDNVIVLDDLHAERILREYVRYCHGRAGHNHAFLAGGQKYISSGVWPEAAGKGW